MFNSFWKLHGEKIISILKGAGIAAAGAAITFAIPFITGAEYSSPQVAVAVSATVMVVVNSLRKFGVPIVTGKDGDGNNTGM